MILDYNKYGPLEREYNSGNVLVDGRVIRAVFYVDTEAGFVRSYDVLGDGKAHSIHEDVTVEQPFELREGAVYFKTVRGVVELHKKQ